MAFKTGPGSAEIQLTILSYCMFKLETSLLKNILKISATYINVDVLEIVSISTFLTSVALILVVFQSLMVVTEVAKNCLSCIFVEV